MLQFATYLALSASFLCGTPTSHPSQPSQPSQPSAPSADTVPSTVSTVRADKHLKVLKLWLQQYRKGDWDVSWHGVYGDHRKKKSLIQKYRLIDLDEWEKNVKDANIRKQLGSAALVTYQEELQFLLDKAVKNGSVDAAKVLLEVAAVGLDRKVKYTPKMVPHTVRGLGEEALLKLKSPAVMDYLAKAASGEADMPKAFKVAMQAAAIRMIGTRQRTDKLDLVKAQLNAEDSTLRLAAIAALRDFGEVTAIEPLADRLGKETDQGVIIDLVEAITRLANGGKPNKEHMRKAASAAAGVLGRSGSWNADMQLVGFLDIARYLRSAPALIAVLERCNDPETKAPESRRLRKRAHEVLTSLTGAFFPATEAGKWREFWNKKGKTLTLQPKKEKATADHGTVASNFFDIPIEGSRVVFVIDISGSMAWKLGGGGGRGTGTRGKKSSKRDIKMEVAREQLIKAVQALPEGSEFNMIAYSTIVKTWKPKLMPASKRNKKAAERWASRLAPSGGTNIFDAMNEALKMKSLVYGDRYDSSVDEIFFLSDGEPNFGKVIDAKEILRIITKTNKHSGVRINTIYLDDGGKSDRERQKAGVPAQRIRGAQLMEKIAQQNGGRFVHLPRPKK